MFCVKKYLSLLLALTLCLCTVCGALAENAGGDTVSKSKTATNLDANLETTVTLSFPSEEVSLDSDVVFVLDKSTSAQVYSEAVRMLDALKEQAIANNTKIKIGVVVFAMKARDASGGLLDVVEQYDQIIKALEFNRSSGTNTHAGLLVGKKMLDEDTSVDASRKHLIFLSDGISYIFNEDPTTIGVNYIHPDTHKLFAHGQLNNDNWGFKYGVSTYTPEDWDAWLKEIGQLVTSQGKQYDHPYVPKEPDEFKNTTNPYWEPLLPINDLNAANNKNYVICNEKALYLTWQVWQDCKNSGYNCYAVVSNENKNYPWGPSFIRHLAKGNASSFPTIQEKILYMLGAGSSVTDVIGKQFDLIPDSFQLTVGGVSYPATRIGNRYYFGEKHQVKEESWYDYEVDYDPNGDDGESFEFTINENVTNFKRVQLSYNLKVSNPKTAPGTYGQYDRDGSKGYDGLHTNESATLIPYDSNQNPGATETFQKPTVSYTVNGAATSVPKTGDASTPALWVALLTLSAAALFVLSRRRAA